MRLYAKPPGCEVMGPLDSDAFKYHLDKGHFPAGTLVCGENDTEWTLIERMPFARQPQQPAARPVAPPSNAGLVFALVAILSIGAIFYVGALISSPSENADTRAAAIEDANAKLTLVANAMAYRELLTEKQTALCKENSRNIPALLEECRRAVDVCVARAQAAYLKGDGKEGSMKLGAAEYEACFLPTFLSGE